jgi:hypothetical protein
LGWDVFEECEDPIVWVLVSKRVEYETVCGDEGVSIHWNPDFFCRKHAPRIRLKANIKKSIASLADRLSELNGFLQKGLVETHYRIAIFVKKDICKNEFILDNNW